MCPCNNREVLPHEMLLQRGVVTESPALILDTISKGYPDDFEGISQQARNMMCFWCLPCVWSKMLPCALSVDKISSISFAFAPSVTLKLKAQCDTEKASYWVRTSAKEESQHFNGAENREFCPACLQSTMLRTFMYVLYNCVTLCNIYNRQN